MKRVPKDLLTTLVQQWVSYGACRDEAVAAEQKRLADKNTKALTTYIEELEGQVAALLSDNERLRKDREAIGKVVAQCGTCTIRYGSMVLSEKWAAGRSLSDETPK